MHHPSRVRQGVLAVPAPVRTRRQAQQGGHHISGMKDGSRSQGIDLTEKVEAWQASL
jgi:hypothetical protein